MAHGYKAIGWNSQKKKYDLATLAFITLYLLVFVACQLWLYPAITVETIIIRSTGTLAFFMLHVILWIGPLCRIDQRFLPLLYNRRHLGVVTFLIALIHGLFNIIQFHALGNENPLVSIFTANLHYDSLVNFPFQVLGFLALSILFLMAATSHDFWLRNLSPRIWKTLHMFVYLAYAMLVSHVMLGVIQFESSPVWIFLMAAGMLSVISLHVYSSYLQNGRDMEAGMLQPDGFCDVCHVNDIETNRAKIVNLEGENIAIFKYDNEISAVSNICRHQHGPLGEGRIVDGCITCPWHGYQYFPHNGQSPPPFEEKIETYDVIVLQSRVLVNPKAYAPGTERSPFELKYEN